MIHLRGFQSLRDDVHLQFRLLHDNTRTQIWPADRQTSFLVFDHHIMFEANSFKSIQYVFVLSCTVYIILYLHDEILYVKLNLGSTRFTPTAFHVWWAQLSFNSAALLKRQCIADFVVDPQLRNTWVSKS